MYFLIFNKKLGKCIFYDVMFKNLFVNKVKYNWMFLSNVNKFVFIVFFFGCKSDFIVFVDWIYLLF